MGAFAHHLAEQVRSAAQSRRPLTIRGGGTKAFYGGAVEGDLLDTRVYHGIIDYAPSELVVTVRAGTGLADLEAELQRHGQMLAFEPPHFGCAATVGGMVAAGLAGPRRLAQGVATGGVRDSVLGVRLIDGRGDVQSFGGRVVKNVAGYDVSRLMAGAHGTLGVLLDVSLRVAPIPVTEVTLRQACTATDALIRMQRWRALPWPVSATSYRDGMLWVRLSGASQAVAETIAAIGGERVTSSQAVEHWRAVRELNFATDKKVTLWRIGLPATAPLLDLPGDMMIEWSGQRRWLLSDAPADAIRSAVKLVGGHATRFRGGDTRVAVFPSQSAVVAEWESRLRAAFDPIGILNPGRMHADSPR
jgi:glycolate oxidase FAD binding subunit